jgi:lysophospholipase L1-like esterase
MFLFNRRTHILKRITWYTIVAFALSGFMIMSAAFVRTIMVTHKAKIANDKNNSTEATVSRDMTINRRNPNSLRITIMGDSIAKGTGDEKSKGMSGYIPEFFKNQTSKELLVENVGIDGLRSEGLLDQLKNGKLGSLLSDSDFIVISIGGNDVSRIAIVRRASREDEFNAILDSYLSNLKEVLRLIRAKNPDAAVIFVGLYDPSGSGETDDNTRLLMTWNYRTQQLIDEDRYSVFVSTFDLFKFNISRYLAADNFHPNSAGYQAISGAISRSVETLLINGTSYRPK